MCLTMWRIWIASSMRSPTRSQVMLERLGRGPASVSELGLLPMSLAAVVQHVQILETSGLVRTQKVGRTRTCSLNPATLRSAEHWMSERRGLVERRLDRLGDYLAETADPADAGRPSLNSRQENHVTEPSVIHDTFAIERTYPAPASRVFAAFATKEAKDAWGDTGDLPSRARTRPSPSSTSGSAGTSASASGTRASATATTPATTNAPASGSSTAMRCTPTGPHLVSVATIEFATTADATGPP